MQPEGHFLFVDLIMLSSFVTPCFFPYYIAFRKSCQARRPQRKRRGDKLANINVDKWGKQRFPICQC